MNLLAIKRKLSNEVVDVDNNEEEKILRSLEDMQISRMETLKNQTLSLIRERSKGTPGAGGSGLIYKMHNEDEDTD